MMRSGVFARASTTRSPAACSGLTYSGVPRLAPVSVRRLAASWTASAIPKSASTASPSCRRMLSGLMS
ncbi:MAG TPA: hypothetical protein VFU90_10140, partial [Candidatus Tumulicola sp.]|nr:hypothetical protein [Candidatus Tumulicola sp.]